MDLVGQREPLLIVALPIEDRHQFGGFILVGELDTEIVLRDVKGVETFRITGSVGLVPGRHDLSQRLSRLNDLDRVPAIRIVEIVTELVEQFFQGRRRSRAGSFELLSADTTPFIIQNGHFDGKSHTSSRGQRFERISPRRSGNTMRGHRGLSQRCFTGSPRVSCMQAW